MLFNSLAFALFLPIVFLLYWLVARGNTRFQNGLLLLASYFFYACWDYRFLGLLVFSTLLCYAAGIRLAASITSAERKFYLWGSILSSIGILGVYKYFNFFSQSFSDGLHLLGLSTHPILLQLVLPIGISFYTFHGLSYVIDCYYERIQPERNLIDYGLFVSYFPLLVAGPIERATHLLPQLKKEKSFNYTSAVDGLRQILWGLFKKVVIADNCAAIANQSFEHIETSSGSTLLVGALMFAFQIYGDFSGYSDIALGTSRLFGIELLRNFSFPYFSRDIAEFWRRWHISLTTWFRDYLYIPLGGSKGGTWMKVRNTFIIFLVSGFWHGASWTFIVWGALNAFYFLPLLLTNSNRTNIEIVAQGKWFPSVKESLQMCGTFSLTVLAWVFFRAKTIGQAFDYLGGIVSPSFFTMPKLSPNPVYGLLLVFLLIEWIGREQRYALESFGLSWPKPVRWLVYYGLVGAIVMLAGTNQEFIYFQF